MFFFVAKRDGMRIGKNCCSRPDCDQNIRPSLSLDGLCCELQRRKRIPYDTLELDFALSLPEFDGQTPREVGAKLAESIRSTALSRAPNLLVTFRHRSSRVMSCEGEDEFWSSVFSAFSGTIQLSLFNFPGNLPITLHVVRRQFRRLHGFALTNDPFPICYRGHVTVDKGFGLRDNDIDNIVLLIKQNTHSLTKLRLRDLVMIDTRHFMGMYSRFVPLRDAIMHAVNLDDCVVTGKIHCVLLNYRERRLQAYDRNFYPARTIDIPDREREKLRIGRKLTRAKLSCEAGNQPVLCLPYDAWSKVVAESLVNLSLLYSILRSSDAHLLTLTNRIAEVNERRNEGYTEDSGSSEEEGNEPPAVRRMRLRGDRTFASVAFKGSHLTLELAVGDPIMRNYRPVLRNFATATDQGGVLSLEIRNRIWNQDPYRHSFFVHASRQEFEYLLSGISKVANPNLDLAIINLSLHGSDSTREDDRISALIEVLPKKMKALVIANVDHNINRILHKVRTHFDGLTELSILGPPRLRIPRITTSADRNIMISITKTVGRFIGTLQKMQMVGIPISDRLIKPFSDQEDHDRSQPQLEACDLFQPLIDILRHNTTVTTAVLQFLFHDRPTDHWIPVRCHSKAIHSGRRFERTRSVMFPNGPESISKRDMEQALTIFRNDPGHLYHLIRGGIDTFARIIGGSPPAKKKRKDSVVNHTHRRAKKTRSALLLRDDQYFLFRTSVGPLRTGKFTLDVAARDVPDKGNAEIQPDYARDIFERLFLSEKENKISHYMPRQPELTLDIRAATVDWLVKIHSKWNFHQVTLYLAVSIFDRYVEKVPLRGEARKVAVTSLMIASKTEEPEPCDFISCATVCGYPCTAAELSFLEHTIVERLNWRLRPPTAHSFLVRFLLITGATPAQRAWANYYTERTLQEYWTLKYRPSLVAASCITLAEGAGAEMPSLTPPSIIVESTGFDPAAIVQVAVKIRNACRRPSSLNNVQKKHKLDTGKTPWS